MKWPRLHPDAMIKLDFVVYMQFCQMIQKADKRCTAARSLKSVTIAVCFVTVYHQRIMHLLASTGSLTSITANPVFRLKCLETGSVHFPTPHGCAPDQAARTLIASQKVGYPRPFSAKSVEGPPDNPSDEVNLYIYLPFPPSNLGRP